MRRPLARIPFDDEKAETLFGPSPFERLMDYFGWVSLGMPPYLQWTESPVFTGYSDVHQLASILGFSSTPLRRVEYYPEKALRDEATGRSQHPKNFLQWGWAHLPHKQLVLEIADATGLLGFHFIKAEPGNNGTPWHLDQLHVAGGKAGLMKLRCGEPENFESIKQLLLCAQAVVSNLNQDNWQKAERIFHETIRAVSEKIEDESRISIFTHDMPAAIPRASYRSS